MRKTYGTRNEENPWKDKVTFYNDGLTYRERGETIGGLTWEDGREREAKSSRQRNGFYKDGQREHIQGRKVKDRMQRKSFVQCYKRCATEGKSEKELSLTFPGVRGRQQHTRS